MSEEILINVTPQETRVAVVENGVLQEVYVERTRRRGLVGNIFKGRVSRVLPGMQAAFVDVGLERTGFLHISDMSSTLEEVEAGERLRAIPEVSIDSVLKEGQDLLVQVIKDPIGSKGARLTTRLSIPSRYVVFVPDQPSIGISQRIEDEAERERLRTIVFGYQSTVEKLAAAGDRKVVPHGAMRDAESLGKGGFIVRTAAEGVREDEIWKDIEFVHKLW
ncbi:MAG: ribonuclease E/G, partial [Gammaproteobacteria bacterium]